MKRILCLLCALCAVASARAKIELPALLGSGMVLQRDAEVRLWGDAAAGAEVEILTSWDGARYAVRADRAGHWEAKVRTGAAGGPHSITLSDGEPLTLDDILLGEVWICAGQSNMEMPVQGFFGQPCYHAAETMRDAALWPDIRLFTVERSSQAVPQRDCRGAWLHPTPANVGAFSAVGYFFGRCLHRYLDVPVGLVAVHWGGTNIEAWMDAAALAGLDVDRDFIARNWTETHSAPSVLYNGMVAPATRMTARGFIWYQGESNIGNYYDYKTMMAELVRSWRAAWGDDRMPFYYVEIAPYRYDGPDFRARAALVEQQYDALAAIPHAGIASTVDLGMFSLIHEPDKRPVGERLAYMALRRDYGVEGVPSDSPTYRSMEVTEEGRAILSFDNLAAPGDQADPRSFSWLDDEGKVITPVGFEIAGADRVFHPAKARLQWNENRIEVWADEVAEPVAVRYGFRNYVRCNVKTTLGQPLVPFRTDRWEIPSEELFAE